MVIEHSFVTTLDSNEAMRQAATMLASRGFVNAEASGFQVNQGEWRSLEMRRGKTRVNRAAGLIEAPQLVRLEYDRGRVSLAASVATNARTFWTGIGKEVKPSSEAGRKAAALLTAISQSLERLLVQGQGPDQAAAEWLSIDSRLTDESARQRRRRTVILTVAISFCVLAVGALIAATAMFAAR